MTDATLLWSIWQALLQPFHGAFTRLGFRRFAEGVTALALNVEEHPITQSVLALERPADRKARESFAEYGAWDTAAVTRNLTRPVAEAPGRLWHGYHVSAVDDTKVHRSGKHVRGRGTSHEDTARCPNRAPTVRAPNWVVLGALLENPGQPAGFLPRAGRPYFRQSQSPRLSPTSGRREPFRTKCQLAVERHRERARILGGRHLAVFDGGYALHSVIRPRIEPAVGQPRIEFRTRLRHDARLYAPLPERPRPNRKWGHRLPPPRQGGRWTRHGHAGTASSDGRRRKVHGKEIVCFWRASGPEGPVKVVVARVEGYTKRFSPVTSATELTGLQMVELFAARFRQEDGFRDLKPRLGWEECRAWTKNPIERMSQAQWVTMSLLRLAQFRLEAAGEVDWWYRPPWNRKKDRPSVREVERLFRRHRPEIQQFLSDWLGTEGEVA